MSKQFHIQQFDSLPAWPRGGFALYEITGDQIARLVGFDNEGKINRRDGWSGYIGTFETLTEVVKAIEDQPS